MKHKTAVLCALIVFLGSLGSAAAGTVVERNDLQVIRKAVRDDVPEGPATLKDVKWFKVLVTDNLTKKDKVRISLPIALIEVVSRLADDTTFSIDRKNGDMDFSELLAELKKIGPMAVIEICDENETIKVWFE